MRYRVTTAALLAFLALAAHGRALAQEREPGMVMDEERHAQMRAHRQEMAARHEEMMARHKAMMAEMETDDARLDSLVAAMDTAAGEARIDAMAAPLRELVARRGAMCGRMMEMMHGEFQGEHGAAERPEHRHR